MAKSLILKRRVGDVLVATLNRPESLNALSVPLMKAIERFARELIDDPCRVVIIRGSGQHFSAGADLKAPPSDPLPLVQRRRDAGLGGRMLKAILDIPADNDRRDARGGLGWWALYSDRLRFSCRVERCKCGLSRDQPRHESHVAKRWVMSALGRAITRQAHGHFG